MADGGAPRTAPNGPAPSQIQTRKHVVEFIRGTKLTHGEFEVTVDAGGNEISGTTKEVEN